jgi:hypothetical protein
MGLSPAAPRPMVAEKRVDEPALHRHIQRVEGKEKESEEGGQVVPGQLCTQAVGPCRRAGPTYGPTGPAVPARKVSPGLPRGARCCVVGPGRRDAWPRQVRPKLLLLLEGQKYNKQVLRGGTPPGGDHTRQMKQGRLAANNNFIFLLLCKRANF